MSGNDPINIRLLKLARSTYVRSVLIRLLNASLILGVSILLARLLGPEEYGRYGILLSFATILAIPFTSGLPRTMTRDIAIARINEDRSTIRHIIKLGTLTFLGLIPLIFLVALGVYLIGFEVAGFGFGIFVSALLAPIISADSNRLAIMRGLGSAIRSQVPDMLIRPVGTMIIIVVLLVTVGHANAITGVIAYSIATLLGFMVGAKMVRRDLTLLQKQPMNTRSAQSNINKKNFYISIFTMSLLGSAGTLTGNLDMLLLNQFATYESAGQYKVALTGLALVVLGGNAVSAVSFTRLAEAIPQKDKAKIVAHSDQALKWSVLLTFALSFCVLILGKPIINMLYGDNYSDVWPILMILSVGFCIAFCFGQGPEIASLSGAQVPAALLMILSIIITYIIASTTFDSYGTVGIAFASMVGTIMRYFLISLIVYYRLGVNITVFGTIKRKINDKKNSHG